MGFGQRLKAVLDARNMKPADLCKQLDWNTGVLSQYIRDQNRSPKLSTACKVSEVLDVSLDYFAGLIDEPRPIRRDEDGNPVFSDEERALIGLYRDTDERGQRTVMRAAQGAAEDFPGGRAEEAPADTSDVIGA